MVSATAASIADVFAPVATLAALLVAASTTWLTRIRVRRLESRLDEPPRRPVTRGVLICDWVDLTVLTSIAQQRGLDPDPVRRERGEAAQRSRDLEGGSRFLKGRVGRHSKSDQREFYELSEDPNAVLVKVLGELDAD